MIQGLGSRRVGLLATKLGMSTIFDESGKRVPVTVLKLDALQVVGVRTVEQNGYIAVQLGARNAKIKNVSKPARGIFAKAKVEPKMVLREFRVPESSVLEVGAELSASHFVVGQHVDVSAVSQGKGFAGAMKRHNFSGLRATHGVSISHRSHGSTGQCQDPGKVFKGKKMAGHMGASRITKQNLRVVAIDEEANLIMVCGGVPGAKGSNIEIRDAVKRAMPKDLPMPAGIKSSGSDAGQAA